MSSSENSPEPGTSSGARALTYSEVVQGISAPLDNEEKAETGLHGLPMWFLWLRRIIRAFKL